MCSYICFDVLLRLVVAVAAVLVYVSVCVDDINDIINTDIIVIFVVHCRCC